MNMHKNFIARLLRPRSASGIAASLLLAGSLGFGVACGDDAETEPEQDPIEIRISPMAVTIETGEIQQFEATVENAEDDSVTWEVEGEGSVDDEGSYEAPDEAGTYKVVVTSVEDPDATAEATVTVEEPEPEPEPEPELELKVTPTAATILPGATQQLEATVEGDEDAVVSWSVKEADGGSVDDTGLYTAPATEGVFTAVASIEGAEEGDEPITVEVVLTVDAPVSLTLSATTATVAHGGSVDFDVSVEGSSEDVTWSVAGTDSGTVDADGLYTAPSANGEFTVVATSVEDGSVTAEAKVTVTDALTVLADPASATIAPDGTQAFGVTVLNSTADDTVTWSVEGVDSGSIDAAGLYTAPSAAGTYTVVATSNEDGAVSARIEVVVQ